MQVFRLAAILCLLPILSFVQNVIDTQGKSYSEMYGHLGRFGAIRAPPEILVTRKSSAGYSQSRIRETW
jgi:hypothetical protein